MGSLHLSIDADAGQQGAVGVVLPLCLLHQDAFQHEMPQEARGVVLTA